MLFFKYLYGGSGKLFACSKIPELETPEEVSGVLAFMKKGIVTDCTSLKSGMAVATLFPLIAVFLYLYMWKSEKK